MDETMIRCLKRIDGNFGTLDANQKDIWKAIRKNAKKIRGMKGVLVGFGIGMLVLAAELAERKRSQNWLDERIDKLEEYAEKIEKVESDMTETINNDIYPRLNKIDGGVCDA